MHEGYVSYGTLSVCMSFSNSIERFYRILNMAMDFTLDLRDFQVTDFAEKASLEAFAVLAPQHTTAILKSHAQDAVCNTEVPWNM